MSESKLDLPLPCDAPPWGVVVACRTLGFQKPEDVAWFRVGMAVNQICCCANLQKLEAYQFEYANGVQELYMLLQCSGCKGVWWRPQ